MDGWMRSTGWAVCTIG